MLFSDKDNTLYFPYKITHYNRSCQLPKSVKILGADVFSIVIQTSKVVFCFCVQFQYHRLRQNYLECL